MLESRRWRRNKSLQLDLVQRQQRVAGQVRVGPLNQCRTALGVSQCRFDMPIVDGHSPCTQDTSELYLRHAVLGGRPGGKSSEFGWSGTRRAKGSTAPDTSLEWLADSKCRGGVQFYRGMWSQVGRGMCSQANAVGCELFCGVCLVCLVCLVEIQMCLLLTRDSPLENAPPSKLPNEEITLQSSLRHRRVTRERGKGTVARSLC